MEVKLNELTAVTVAFPPCADVLLALIDRQVSDEITRFFDEISAFADTKSWRSRQTYNSTMCSIRSC